MTISVLCESPRVRHPQEKCASKCVRSIVSLCLHLFFITYALNFVLCALCFVGPVAQLESERDRAKVEVTRSNRVRSTSLCVGCSSTGRALHCDCSRCGFKSRQPTQQSSKFRVQNTNCRNCGREVRHLVVNQADDGSSPFSSAMRQ